MDAAFRRYWGAQPLWVRSRLKANPLGEELSSAGRISGMMRLSLRI